MLAQRSHGTTPRRQGDSGGDHHELARAPVSARAEYPHTERVEPGALWFESEISPLTAPSQANALAQVGWRVTVVLASAQGVWHLIELGNVYS